MPVLKHYKGNCHVYVDRAADLDMAERILVNAKCQRPGVCNAAESLLVHARRRRRLPAARGRGPAGSRASSCAAAATRAARVPDAKPATDDDYAAEYLDLILSVKVVADLDEAIDHISRYGSQHTEAIVTQRPGTRPGGSRPRSIRPRSWSTPARASTTASSSASAPRSASAPTSFMPAARAGCKNCAATSTSSMATARCASECAGCLARQCVSDQAADCESRPRDHAR